MSSEHGPPRAAPAFDLSDFDLGEMTRLGGELRRAGADAGSMEDAAGRVVRLMYDALLDGAGRRAFALVRMFNFAELPADLRTVARAACPTSPWPTLRCLTLLASAGARPEWNSRAGSSGHRAIPLLNRESVESAPMIASLLGQLGLDVGDVVEPERGLFLEKSSTPFNVFHVQVARGSPIVPAQDNFVIPHGIQSVLGLGGALRSGEIFAMISFSLTTIDPDTAQLFKTLSLNIKLAIAPHEDQVFA